MLTPRRNISRGRWETDRSVSAEVLLSVLLVGLFFGREVYDIKLAIAVPVIPSILMQTKVHTFLEVARLGKPGNGKKLLFRLPSSQLLCKVLYLECNWCSQVCMRWWNELLNQWIAVRKAFVLDILLAALDAEKLTCMRGSIRNMKPWFPDFHGEKFVLVIRHLGWHWHMRRVKGNDHFQCRNPQEMISSDA